MTEGRRKFVFGGASALLVAACGGGGGETGPAPEPIAQTPAPAPAVADPVPTSTPLRYGFRLRVTATPWLPSSASLLDVFTVDPGTGAVRLLRTVRDEEMGVSVARRAQPDPAGRFIYLSGFVGPVLITIHGATGNFETRANDFNMATGEIAASGRPAFYPSGVDAITPDGLARAVPLPDRCRHGCTHGLATHATDRGAVALCVHRQRPRVGSPGGRPMDAALLRCRDGRLRGPAAGRRHRRWRVCRSVGDYVTPLAINSTGNVILVQRGAGQVSLQGYRWNATRDAVAAIGAPLVVPVTAPREFKLIPDPAGPYFRSAARVFRVVAPAGVQLTATGTVIPDSWIVTPP